MDNFNNNSTGFNVDENKNSSDVQQELKNENGFTVKSEQEEPTEKEEKHDFASEIFEWLDVLVTAIVAVVIIFSLIFRVATIDGPSMQNTLFTNDKVIITNLLYEPKVGDIVVVSRNIENSIEGEDTSDLPIIKRVIAVAGQTVDIDFDKCIVKVDGVALDEPYIKTPTGMPYPTIDFPTIVPDGCIFVMGDNRMNSLDSRSPRIGNNGMIDTRYVLGHAILRVFPFNSVGILK